MENKYEVTTCKYSAGLHCNNKKSKANPRHNLKAYCIGFTNIKSEMFLLSNHNIGKYTRKICSIYNKLIKQINTQ